LSFLTDFFLQKQQQKKQNSNEGKERKNRPVFELGLLPVLVE
jgi:hypothetical protein